MKRFGWVFIAIALIAAGCSRQELAEKEPPKAKESGPTWTAIPGTDDRILVVSQKGPTREAVIDVKWDDANRKKGVADGFARAGEAVSTRAIYRFNCKTLQMQTQSYSVLSARGEALTSQVHSGPKPVPVEPATTGAKYLAAACGNALGPKVRQRLKIG